MLELIREHPEILQTHRGTYRARAYGVRNDSGFWEGYVLFVPAGGERILATDRETTQDTREELVSWAASLSLEYLERALARALERQPEVQLSRRLAEIERLEADARARADALARAADLTRADAEAAGRELRATDGAITDAGADTTDAADAAQEELAAHARVEADDASVARLVDEHAVARAEEAAASRVAEQHQRTASPTPTSAGGKRRRNRS